MPPLTGRISGTFNRVESFFDGLMLGYKWRYNRFGPITIIAYRGFGTSGEVSLKGRVLDGKEIVRGDKDSSVWQNIRLTLQRIATDEIPGATVRLHFQDQTFETLTNDEGIFEFTFEPPEAFSGNDIWHPASVELLSPPSRKQEEVWAEAEILIPAPESEFGVISDIDDTIMRTGATDILRILRSVLLNYGGGRVPFEGVAALYRELQKGPDGKGKNPVFYVSSSPVNLYEHFAYFMEERDVPRGPIFLKNFGFTKEQFFSSGHDAHKIMHVNAVLDTYPELPFVLVGDSGQRDPEIYRQIVQKHSDRIKAIYIRDVTPRVKNERDAEAQAVAEELEALGVPMVVAEDSEAAAEHAAEIGLIAPEGVDRVRQDRRQGGR